MSPEDYGPEDEVWQEPADEVMRVIHCSSGRSRAQRIGARSELMMRRSTRMIPQGGALVRTILFRKNRVGYVNNFLTLRVQEHIAGKTA